MNANVNIVVDVKLECWATPQPDVDLDEFVQRMRDIGNQVLEVDRENRRVLIGKVD